MSSVASAPAWWRAGPGRHTGDRAQSGSSVHDLGGYSFRSISMPTAGGVWQMRSDLGVLDPPSTAAVLPLHPDRVRSLFTSPVSSITNTACRVGEMVDDVVAGLLRPPVRVPGSPGQQVLRAVRTGVAGVLGDRPA